MIKHIVMFKLANQNEETQEALVSALNGMAGKIDVLKHLEVGVDFKKGPNSYDVILTTHFENKDGLQAYSSHPVHQPVLQLVNTLCSGRTVVDYETP